jgi:hypothetical protein
MEEKIYLVGLKKNRDSQVEVRSCGHHKVVIINPNWTGVIERRLRYESVRTKDNQLAHPEHISYTIMNNAFVRCSWDVLDSLRVYAQLDRYDKEYAVERRQWMSEFAKVAPEMLDMYNSDRENALNVMRSAVAGWNVSSCTTEPTLKRNVWIAPDDIKFYSGMTVKKGEAFIHNNERIKWVERVTDLDVIKNYVQVKYYQLLDIVDAKLESENDRYIKAIAQELGELDINPDWLGYEGFEDRLVGVMDIKNRVTAEQFARALEIAF